MSEPSDVVQRARQALDKEAQGHGDPRPVRNLPAHATTQASSSHARRWRVGSGKELTLTVNMCNVLGVRERPSHQTLERQI